jgi:hypothetical protein
MKKYGLIAEQNKEVKFLFECMDDALQSVEESCKSMQDTQ